MNWFKKLFSNRLVLQDKILPLTQAEIKALVTSQCNADVKFFHEDKEYYAPSYRDLKELIMLCPSKRFKYVPESRDCDDFCRIFRGWLSEQGMGNLTCAKVHIKTGKVVHAMILAIASDKTVYFIEPQNGKITEPYGTTLKVFA
jgi:hypothetical protein